MLRTYKAILHGDQVEWIDPPPERKDVMEVHITLLEEKRPMTYQERSRVIVESLTALAEKSTFSEIIDPVAWQREQRRDRTLPHLFRSSASENR